MKSSWIAAAVMALSVGSGQAQQARTILFIGNSFTFGEHSPVHFWRANTVTDLNHGGVGGVPAIFKAFADEEGVPYDVYVETRPGQAFSYHLREKLPEITSHAWDAVIAHSYSTLDKNHPGDPAELLASGRQLADVLHQKSPNVDFYVMATWSRPDQTFPEGKPWHGKSIYQMGDGVNAAYDSLAATVPGVTGVIAVGEAFNRAIKTGVADGNPYDGIDAGKVDLWAWDYYHASTYGYYLEALMDFGSVTGIDPNALGRGECASYELGMSPDQAQALQRVAHDELVADGVKLHTPAGKTPAARPATCKSR